MENQTIQPKKLPKLTKKEKGFVKDFIKTGNGTKAILNNYDTDNENVAGVMANENLRKPKIQEAILSIAERLPDEDLLQVHKEGLQAGKKTEEGIEPDYAVRHKYLESAYKLKGLYGEEPEKPKGANTTYNFIFNNETQETIKILNETIKNKLLGNV